MPPKAAPKGALVVLGAQWGDEGKGKIVDVLCESVDIVGRCQGGSNAGHTIKVAEDTLTAAAQPKHIARNIFEANKPRLRGFSLKLARTKRKEASRERAEGGDSQFASQN